MSLVCLSCRETDEKRDRERGKERKRERFKVWTSLQMVLATATATDLAQIGFATFEAGKAEQSRAQVLLGNSIKIQTRNFIECVRVCVQLN